jgi:nitroreductase/NAD-dependent dihydropyrimidine dehydrogenase PreA subunit
MSNIEINQEICSLCGACTEVCTRRLLSLQDDGLHFSDDFCSLCGHCKAVCPENAIDIPELNPDEYKDAPGSSQIPAPDLLLDFFRSRRSVRMYKKDPVPKEKIEQIVEAGRFAPTGGNRQPLLYTVVQTSEILDQVRDTCINFHADNADALLATLSQKEKQGLALSPADLAMKQYAEAWPFRRELNNQGIDTLFHHAPVLVNIHANTDASPNPEVDAGIASTQMVLMAESLGLGTCYLGFLVMAAQTSPDLKKLLALGEKDKTVVAFVAGYPNVDYLRLVSRNPARVTWL